MNWYAYIKNTKRCAACQIPIKHGLSLGLNFCDALQCKSDIQQHLANGNSCCAICGQVLKVLSYRFANRPLCNSQACRDKIAWLQNPASVFCNACGVFLSHNSIELAEVVCDNSICHFIHQQQKSRLLSKQIQMLRDKQQMLLIEKAREQALVMDLKSNKRQGYDCVVVPFLTKSIDRADEFRQSIFKQSLLSLANQAFALGEEDDQIVVSTQYDDSLAVEPGNIKQIEAGQNARNDNSLFDHLNGVACGLCGGHCCQNGGTHAYLKVSNLHEYFVKNPNAKPGDLVEHYARYLPAETYLHSCVYHGRQGCGLPRDLRSDTCNVYLCSSLSQLKSKVDAGSVEFIIASSNLREPLDEPPRIYQLKIHPS